MQFQPDSIVRNKLFLDDLDRMEFQIRLRNVFVIHAICDQKYFYTNHFLNAFLNIGKRVYTKSFGFVEQCVQNAGNSDIDEAQEYLDVYRTEVQAILNEKLACNYDYIFHRVGKQLFPLKYHYLFQRLYQEYLYWTRLIYNL